MYFAVGLEPEAGGVESADLGICIEDILMHHLREAIRDETRPKSDYYEWAGMMPIPHIKVRKSWTCYLRRIP